MTTTETRETRLNVYQLRCVKCRRVQTFKWPADLERGKPEFILCHNCQSPISTQFDSVPQPNHLATPEKPAVTDVKAKRPEVTIVVYEGTRAVTEVSLDRLLSLIGQFGQKSGWLAKYGDEEASAEYTYAKDQLYAALGVKQS